MSFFFQFLKYGFASIFTYAFLFGGVYFFTDILGIKANISYLIILTATYILNYFLALKLVFLKDHNSRNAALFIGYVFIFWILNNLIFNVLFKTITIHYLFIVAINIAIFAPIRFLTLRHVVFKS